MKTSCIVIFLVLLVNVSFAQVEIKGVVKNDSTSQVIPFASIGFVNKGVGTISNERGEFHLTVPDHLRYDTLMFSCIGYKTKGVLITDFRDDSLVYLTEKTFQLEAVSVSPTRTASKGREKERGIIVLLSSQKSGETLSGKEVGMVFSNRKKIRLREINFFVYGHTFDEAILRVNIYDAKRSGVDERINKQELFVTLTDKESGLVNISLNEDIIFNKRDFIISVELLKVTPTLGEFALVAGFKPLGKRAVVRDVSFGEWKKQPLNLSINVNHDVF